MIMLVGLLGKNAILIVEYAVQLRHEGASIKDAAIEAGKLRFRPIQMTSFAFVAGLIPLVVSHGAGAIANRTIGITGVGGMLLGTVVGVIVIPGLYYVFARMSDGRKLLRDEVDTPLSEPSEETPFTFDDPDYEPPAEPGDHAEPAESVVAPEPADTVDQAGPEEPEPEPEPEKPVLPTETPKPEGTEEPS